MNSRTIPAMCHCRRASLVKAKRCSRIRPAFRSASASCIVVLICRPPISVVPSLCSLTVHATIPYAGSAAPAREDVFSTKMKADCARKGAFQKTSCVCSGPMRIGGMAGIRNEQRERVSRTPMGRGSGGSTRGGPPAQLLLGQNNPGRVNRDELQ